MRAVLGVWWAMCAVLLVVYGIGGHASARDDSAHHEAGSVLVKGVFERFETITDRDVVVGVANSQTGDRVALQSATSESTGIYFVDGSRDDRAVMKITPRGIHIKNSRGKKFLISLDALAKLGKPETE